jgi:ATP-binding cassette subfamily C protein
MKHDSNNASNNDNNKDSNNEAGINITGDETRDYKYTVWQNVKFILNSCRKHDKSIFVYFGFYSILSGILPFIGIIFPKLILDELAGGKNLERLIYLLIGFFISSAFVGYFVTFLKSAYFPKMINIRLKHITNYSMKCMTTDYKNTEDPSFLNSIQTGFRALDNNMDGLEGILHKLFPMGGNVIVLFGYMLIIGKLNSIILAYLIINIAFVYYLTLRVKKFEYKQADAVSDNERHSSYLYGLMYNFSYGKDMRIYGLTDWIGSLFKNYKMNRYEIHGSIKLKYQKVGIIEIIFLIVREGLVYAYLIYQVMNSGLGIGSFTMYFAAIANFANAMKVIMDDIAHIRAQSLYITDLRNFMDQKETAHKEHPTSIPEGPYEIEFRNVSFKYPGNDNYVYKNISFKIKAGQKLAIVGHNGAGKTTLIKLLCRMYEPESGEILINGINIQEFPKEEYYKLFSAVFQEIKTLAFSVAENITLTEEEVNEEKILKCLEKTGMKDKVLSLKNGIHTSMQKILDDEGVEFSGGETQRIVLARALYKDAGIVILDEPTAALDALAERNIYEKFNEMVEGKTAIFISHRLASTSFCDIIALFEDGSLVEYGTHEELLEQSGKYADMFRVQAQYYKEDESKQQERNITDDISDNLWQCS